MIQQDPHDTPRVIALQAGSEAPARPGEPAPLDTLYLQRAATPVTAQHAVGVAIRLLQAAPFVLVLIAIALVAEVTVLSPQHLEWNRWAYSEWLINYSGGFIRRGLSGALIRSDQAVPTLEIVNAVVFVVFAAFCLLFWRVLERSAARGDVWAAWAVILALMIPNGPVQMALSNEMFYRKEIVFHVALGLDCIVYRMIAGAHDDGRRAQWSWLFFALLLVQTIALPLFHEVYLFLSFPACWLLARHVAALQPQRRVMRVLAAASVIVSLAMMAVCVLFSGNEATAEHVWNSLSGTDRSLIAPAAPNLPAGGIVAIGWSTADTFADVGKILLSSQFWLWGFVAAGTGAVLVVITVLRRGPQVAASESLPLLRRHLEQLWFLVLAALPMYLIAPDWARWLSATAISYLFLSFTDSTGAIEPPSLLRLVPRRWRSSAERMRDYCAERAIPAISAFVTRRRFAVLACVLFYCLTFRPPECCMKVGFNPFYRAKQLVVELSHPHR